MVITSPERILTDRRFFELWKSKRFGSKLRSFIFDEAHCISQWSGKDFRPDYAEVGSLRWMVPAHVVFYAASATMPHYVLVHVKELLQMRANTREIRLSNDRPNIHLATLEMLDPLNSCHDLVRVLSFTGDPPPPPFMVFCNDRKETERLCLFARSLAPTDSVDKLLWFHSGMSAHFRTVTIEKLRTSQIWGIFCTDAAGMVRQFRIAVVLCLVNYVIGS